MRTAQSQGKHSSSEPLTRGWCVRHWATGGGGVVFMWGCKVIHHSQILLIVSLIHPKRGSGGKHTIADPHVYYYFICFLYIFIMASLNRHCCVPFCTSDCRYLNKQAMVLWKNPWYVTSFAELTQIRCRQSCFNDTSCFFINLSCIKLI